MKEGYSALAEHYDSLMSDFDYAKTAEFILAESVGAKTVLDLACGTGRMTILLKKAGLNSEGVDSSVEMLSKAFENMREEGLVIPFAQGKLQNFSFHKTYDLVTVVCDGLNYLSQKEMAASFRCISSHLSHGGKLIFDVSSPFKLINVLGNNFFYEDYDDKTLFWTNKLAKNKNYVDMTISLFTKKGEVYHRADESQRQYAHTADELIAAANVVGLSQKKIFDGETFGKLRDKSNRFLFVFEKQ